MMFVCLLMFSFCLFWFCTDFNLYLYWMTIQYLLFGRLLFIWIKLEPVLNGNQVLVDFSFLGKMWLIWNINFYWRRLNIDFYYFRSIGVDPFNAIFIRNEDFYGHVPYCFALSDFDFFIIFSRKKNSTIKNS